MRVFRDSIIASLGTDATGLIYTNQQLDEEAIPEFLQLLNANAGR